MNIKKLVGTILIACIGGLVAILAYTYIAGGYNSGTQDRTDTNDIRYSGIPVNFTMSEYGDFTYAAGKSVNAVVHVMTQYTKTTTYRNPLYDFFFGDGGIRQYEEPVITSGSGVIISDDGYIVTNNHVVDRSEYIEVVLNDKRSFPAKLVGRDLTTDLALLKIDAKNLSYLKYGNSDELKVGEWVIAVGNPFNLTSTITAGIVSAKARNINILSNKYAIESFIQTDAVVNRGNSGGALVNTKGELVGINTAIYSNTGSFLGYSFAIPVCIVKKIVDDIIEYGEVQRAYMNVSIRDIDQKLAGELNLDKIQGVYITSVNKGGAGDKAGMKQGDVIVKIADHYVNNVPEMQEQLSKYRPGDKINISVKRDGKIKGLLVTLNNKMGNTGIVRSEIIASLGAKFQEVSLDEKKKLKLDHGLKIVELGRGKLKQAGIEEGFIVTSINRKPIYKVDDINDILDKSKEGVIFEGVYPSGVTAYYAFGM